MDHVRSEWHVTGAGVTWDFRGGSRTTCRGKSRGDGWDRYKDEEEQQSSNPEKTPKASGSVSVFKGTALRQVVERIALRKGTGGQWETPNQTTDSDLDNESRFNKVRLKAQL